MFARTKRMPAPLMGLVIVLVEDDPDALALFRVNLEYEGALVMSAPAAQPALDMLSRMRPDVLVTDMTMPGWDGAWLVTEARRRGLLKGVATLVVTAIAMPPQQVREAGFDAYLRKPVDPHHLRRSTPWRAQAGIRASDANHGKTNRPPVDHPVVKMPAPRTLTRAFRIGAVGGCSTANP